MFHPLAEPARVPQPGMAECPPLPPCPVCGGLECLCRPRFFAGQLLTDEDLNRLDRYIIEKNRLHNRYLHGWGVVCGLEVVCHPCPDHVTVRIGYALAPCGDDIIVCRDEPVPICELIHKCRPPEPPGECVPPRPAPDPACREVLEEWVLAVCYDEKLSRGITALKGSSGAACCSRCACGGSAACGCSCHGSSHGNGKSGTAKTNGHGERAGRPPAPQCEPTQVCEGYSFLVYKAPPKDPIRDPRRPAIDLQSELIQGALTCYRLLLERLSQIPTGGTADQLLAWCCETKETLLDFFTRHGTYDCTLYERLGLIACPAPNPQETGPQYLARLAPVVAQITALEAEYLRYCLCAALLPPCPPPVDCNCVPLATVTVRKADCRVLKVCNWGVRRFVVTFPHLGYWLGPSGVLDGIRRAMEERCCQPFRQRGVQLPPPPPNQPGDVPVGGGVFPGGGLAAKPGPFASLFGQSWLNRSRSVDEQILLLAALGAVGENGLPFASEQELGDPVTFLLLNQVVRPVLESSLPAGLPDFLEKLAGGTAAPDQGAAGDTVVQELATLRELVAGLQRTVQAQGEEIERLRRPPG